MEKRTQKERREVGRMEGRKAKKYYRAQDKRSHHVTVASLGEKAAWHEGE